MTNDKQPPIPSEDPRAPGPLYFPRPGRTYEPRTAPDTTPKDSDATD